MRLQARNTRDVWYCLYQGAEDQTNGYSGWETSEQKVIYGKPVKARMNVAFTSGMAREMPYGISVPYDKLLVTCDMDCPIDEHSVLFIDKSPEESDYDGNPNYDYIVTRVAPYLSHILISVKKVKTS